MAFQSLVESLPIKSGGFELKDQLQVSPAAYIAGLEQALAFFEGENGICPPLEQLSGGAEGTERRWVSLLETRCRTGQPGSSQVLDISSQGHVDLIE